MHMMYILISISLSLITYISYKKINPLSLRKDWTSVLLWASPLSLYLSRTSHASLPGRHAYSREFALSRNSVHNRLYYYYHYMHTYIYLCTHICMYVLCTCNSLLLFFFLFTVLVLLTSSYIIYIYIYVYIFIFTFIYIYII